MKTKASAAAVKNFVLSHSLLLLFASVSLVVFVASAYNYVAISFFVKANEHNVKGRLRETALRLAAMTAAEELDAYRGPADMELPGYRALRLRLAEFAAEADVLYAYYLRTIGDEMQYIVDNDFGEKTRVGLDTPPTKSADSPGLSAALKGEVGVSGLGEYMLGWEDLCSAYAPMLGRDGAIAAFSGVDIRDTEMIAMRRKGRWALLLETASAVLMVSGGVYGFIKYRREAHSAQSANAAKSRFLSRMSHDIRTPMNAVMGMSDMALMEYGKPKGMEHIADIKRAGGHLLELINEILDFSALESGKLQIREKPYKLGTALNDTLSIMRTRLKASVELVLDIDPRLPSGLVGDDTRVKEVLLNLLSNAEKYTPKGFIRLAARSQREAGGKAILAFEVSDSGIGIKPEDMDALFADFSRVENRHTAGIQGTGLGLAITRTLCRTMGGDVAASSRYGVGSTFTATIRQGVIDDAPMGGSVEGPAVAYEEPAAPDFAAPDFRVLIVDDSVTNLKVAEGLISPYRVQADTCLSGPDAIELVQKNEYGLVLMDHMMPGMDGIETLAAIRALGGAYLYLPIVALTASDAARERFIRQGFDDFLSKPIEAPKLRDLLERWGRASKKAAPPEMEFGGDLIDGSLCKPRLRRACSPAPDGLGLILK